jgi:hypothetical protein
MKSVIVYALLFAILLQAAGCYSFYPLEKNESAKDYLKEENRLEFRLKNGDKYQFSSKECRFIDKPGNYIFGVGTITDKTTQVKEGFSGEVIMEVVDSITNFTMDSKKYVSYLLKDSTKILFEESNVMIITPETAPDFWIIMNDRSPKIIYNSDIKWIQVEKLNTEKLIVSGVICAALIFIFYKAMANSSWSFGGFGFGGKL